MEHPLFTKTLGEIEMSHTSGPWKIFEGWGADKRRPVIVDSIPDVDGKFVGNCICYAASTNPDMDGNASLIAAAPEMLECLQLAVDYLGFFATPEANALWGKVASAIRKANGEETK